MMLIALLVIVVVLIWMVKSRKSRRSYVQYSVFDDKLHGSYKTIHDVTGVVQDIWVFADISTEDRGKSSEDDAMFTIDILQRNALGSQSILHKPIVVSHKTEQAMCVSDHLLSHHIGPTDVLVVRRQSVKDARFARSTVRFTHSSK